MTASKPVFVDDTLLFPDEIVEIAGSKIGISQ